jgi:hypothetical protein
MLILRLLGGQSLIDISVLVLDYLRGKGDKNCNDQYWIVLLSLCP